MKLYLSSYRIPTPEDLYELVGKTKDIKIAIITNAKDNRDRIDSKQKTDALMNYLGSLGGTSVLFDLRTLKAQNIMATFSDFDMIYAHGGNTFNLRQAMSVSGFDDVIRDVFDAGVVYVGESAGAIVMGPTLKGFETMDALEEVKGDVVWEGLGLVDKVLLPHADNLEYKDRVKPMTQTYPDVIVLNDNQAYVVNGDNAKIVTGLPQ